MMEPLVLAWGHDDTGSVWMLRCISTGRSGLRHRGIGSMACKTDGSGHPVCFINSAPSMDSAIQLGWRHSDCVCWFGRSDLLSLIGSTPCRYSLVWCSLQPSWVRTSHNRFNLVGWQPRLWRLFRSIWWKNENERMWKFLLYYYMSLSYTSWPCWYKDFIDNVLMQRCLKLVGISSISSA